MGCVPWNMHCLANNPRHVHALLRIHHVVCFLIGKVCIRPLDIHILLHLFEASSLANTLLSAMNPKDYGRTNAHFGVKFVTILSSQIRHDQRG